MIAPLLVVVALLGAWEAYVAISGIDVLLLPPPSAIASALVDDRALIWDNFAVTAREIALGLLVAVAAGLLVAVALHFSRTLRRALYPLLVGSQTVPVPIFAAVLVTWFGFDLTPKLFIVALVCFFPIVVPTLDALGSADPAQGKLLRTLGASRWQRFRHVEAPSALPGLFTGLKLSVAIAAIAAILAEQAGSSEGIGYLVTQAIPQLETARAWAAVVVLSLFSIALFAALSLAERRAAPWAHRPGGRTP